MKHKPDLALMDIMIKGDMNGIAAAEEIKRNMDIPVVFLTAYADEGTLNEAKMAEPHGNLHFCGEHTALSNRGMEGAMESGERVAFEVMDAI